MAEVNREGTYTKNSTNNRCPHSASARPRKQTMFCWCDGGLTKLRSCLTIEGIWVPAGKCRSRQTGRGMQIGASANAYCRAITAVDSELTTCFRPEIFNHVPEGLPRTAIPGVCIYLYVRC